MTLPCITKARRFDAQAHRPFLMEGQQVGWIRATDVPLLARWPDVFDVDAAGVTLSSRYSSLDMRSAALGAVIGALAADGRIPGWRDETYAIRNHFDAQPLWSVFRQSVFGNMMNPKVTLFFLVFLPQFIEPHGVQSVPVQMLELGLVFMLQTVVVFSLFGVCAGMIGSWLKRRPRVGVWLDRLAGATFIAIGIRVALRD